MYTMFVAIQDDLDQSGMIDVVVHWEDAPSVVLTLDKRFTNDQAIELLHTSRFTVVGKVTPTLPNDDEALNLYRRSVMALLPALTKMSMWGMLTLLASVARAVEGSDWWALSYHLLPFFKDHALDEITVAEVDPTRWRSSPRRGSERPRSIRPCGSSRWSWTGDRVRADRPGQPRAGP